ncbi:hypothetical protein HYW21_08535 [Candidatus Woesearchaeota archaeon]|nr:hypothetical protein [Candidatus Woesearchaeota archaeon]
MRVWRVIDNTNSNGNHTDEQRKSLERLLRLYTSDRESTVVLPTTSVGEQEEIIRDLLKDYGDDLYLVFHTGDGGVMQGINVIAQSDAQPTIVPLHAGSYNIIYARYAGFHGHPLRDLQKVLMSIDTLPRRNLPLLCIEDDQRKKRYGGVFANGSVVRLIDDYENGTRADAGTFRLGVKLGVGILTLNEYHRQLFQKTPMGISMIAAPNHEQGEAFPREYSFNTSFYAILAGMYPYLMNSQFVPFYRKKSPERKGQRNGAICPPQEEEDRYSHVILEDIDLSHPSLSTRLRTVYEMIQGFRHARAIPNRFDGLCERISIHTTEPFPYTLDGERSVPQETSGKATPLAARSVTISTRAFIPCVMLNRANTEELKQRYPLRL